MLTHHVLDGRMSRMKLHVLKVPKLVGRDIAERERFVVKPGVIKEIGSSQEQDVPSGLNIDNNWAWNIWHKSQT